MSSCSICGSDLSTTCAEADIPAQEAGRFLAQELWDDEGQLCSRCLVNRGLLGMMYCHELD
ncbi:MAG: hypothetical protein R6V08_10210 [Desulfuromonadales bacterium]